MGKNRAREKTRLVRNHSCEAIRFHCSFAFQRGLSTILIIVRHFISLTISPPGEFIHAQTHIHRIGIVRQNVFVTTSGLFTPSPLLLTLEVMGVDRVLFSVDYPYSLNLEGRALLDAVPLSDAEKKKISYQNAERLFKLF